MYRRTQGCAVLLGLLLWAQASSGFSGVSISIDPDTSYVTPGQIFNVVVEVDSIGTPCSGFENTLAWDGQDLEFISFQPEERLNELSWAEWVSPDLYPDSTHIYILVYPFQGFLDEPGPLYSFTFRARQIGETPVRISMARFGSAYGGGIFPVLRHDGWVRIMDPTSGISSAQPKSAGRLRVVPNPVGPEGRVEMLLPRGEPARLEIFDISGRLLGSSEISGRTGSSVAGELLSSLTWLEAAGAEASRRGVYLVRLKCGGQTWSTTAVRP